MSARPSRAFCTPTTNHKGPLNQCGDRIRIATMRGVTPDALACHRGVLTPQIMQSVTREEAADRLPSRAGRITTRGAQRSRMNHCHILLPFDLMKVLSGTPYDAPSLVRWSGLREFTQAVGYKCASDGAKKGANRTSF